MTTQAGSGRASVRDILSDEGLGLTQGSSGWSKSMLASAMSAGSDLSRGEAALSLAGGEALGKSMGLSSRKRIERRLAAPYPSVLRALIVAMSGGTSGLTLATDTRMGAYLEGKMPADLMSTGGTVAFDVIDHGEAGTEVIGVSEIPGQMFAWGKGTRMIEGLLSKTEDLARRF